MNLGRATLCALLLMSSVPAKSRAAEAENPQALELLRYFAAVNSVTMLEGAGSHGSLGLSVGAGASVPPSAPESALAQRVLGAEKQEQQALPRLWLTKGLPLPIDIAASAARDANGRFTQAAGMVQWTAFEALGLPALTLRASHARLFGMQATTMTSNSVEGILGFGFWRLFHVYGGFGVSQHSGSLALDSLEHEDMPAMSILAEGQGSNSKYEERWNGSMRRAGIRVAVLPPFVALTAEAEWQERPSYAAKLSVGM